MKPVMFALLALFFQEVMTVVPPEMPKTVHKKQAGSGYMKGSPLWAKQEALKKQAKKQEKREEEEEEEEEKTDAATVPAATVSTGENKEKAVSEVDFWWWAPRMFLAQSSHAILVVIAAYLYRRRAPALRAPGGLESTEVWAYSLFDTRDLGEDKVICGMSLCCPAIQWADTVSNEKVNSMGFWQALALVLVLGSLSCISFGITILIMLCVAVICRQQLRKIFGHSPWSASSCVTDFFTYACCTCCAIAQEAREVDKVRRAQF